MLINHLSSLRKEDGPYLEFLRTVKLSMSVYRLGRGSSDGQQPHDEEEIYYVVSGRGRFIAGEQNETVRSGDILFVPAKEPHRFQDIDEDLELLVFFAPPEGSLR